MAELQRNGVINSLKPRLKSSLCRMTISRFHDHPDVEKFAPLNGIGHRIAAGFALKYCMLATADVDVFPRLGLVPSGKRRPGSSLRGVR